jgi:hypothetical protein
MVRKRLFWPLNYLKLREKFKSPAVFRNMSAFALTLLPGFTIPALGAQEIAKYLRCIFLMRRLVIHCQLLRRLGLSWRCTYAAVQYTDRLFSKIHLTRRSYQLTAAAAIAVAAKVEEAFDEIPSLSMILMADEVRISFIRIPAPNLIAYHSVEITIAISFGGLNCFFARSYIGVCGLLLSNTFWSA